MKKAICFLLILLLISSWCIIGQCESDETKAKELKITLTSVIAKLEGFTVKDWFSSSENRALISLSLLVDFISENSEYDMSGILDRTIYIGIVDDAIVVAYVGSKPSIIVLYSDKSSSAAFSDISDNEMLARLTIKKITDDTYYEVSQRDLLDARDYITDLLDIL